MGLDEIEQRCNDYGVSITLTPQEHTFGKDIRNLELVIKELIIKTSGISGDGTKYLELYESQEKVTSLIRGYNRYISDKVDLDENDVELKMVLDEEFQEFQREYSRIKQIVLEYEQELNKSDLIGTNNQEWESFLEERSKKKVANVIITNRAFDSFQKYFITNSGSKDISLQAVEGLLKALEALETHRDLSIEDKGFSKKLTGTNEGAMEYKMTTSKNGGVFRAIYFYDENNSRIIHNFLFKGEPEEAVNAMKEADAFIKQGSILNHSRTTNDLIEIRQKLSSGDLSENEKRLLFMYKELFRLEKEFQSEENFDIDIDEDAHDGSKAI